MTGSSKTFITLRQSVSKPIHLQICARFKEAIEAGELKHGDRVPSTRVLASQLDVARGTVENAYSMLLGEGIFISKGQAGSYVNTHFKVEAKSQNVSNDSPITAKKTLHSSAISSYIFLPGCPAYDAFPKKTWSRLAAKRARSLSSEDFSHRNPLGYLPLRESIAAYLRLSRGVACEPSQIVLTSGYLGGLDLLARSLSLSKKDIWMEDPGYIYATRLLTEIGANIVQVPVDNEGLIVSEGIKLSPQASLAVVTPSHQSPLGMALSPSRRLELLEWAGRTGAWIIEDDYDGEFQYSGYPLPTLKSLDQYDRVIYAGSFSKTLFPSLRLGYLVLPQSLTDRVTEKATLCYQSLSISPQLVINDFIAEGYFSKHLKSMRSLYAERREITNDALTNIIGSHININPHKKGMHFVANITSRNSDVYVSKEFNKLGYGIQALSNWTSEPTHNGLIIGFTNIPNKKTAEIAAKKLYDFFL